MTFIITSTTGAPGDPKLPIYATEFPATGQVDFWYSPSLAPLLQIITASALLPGEANATGLVNRIPGGTSLQNADPARTGLWRETGGPFGSPAVAMLNGGTGASNTYPHAVAAGSIWGMLLCTIASGQSGTRNILGGRTDLSGGTHRLRYDASAAQLRWVVGGGGVAEVTVLAPLTLDAWCAIVFSFDAATGTAALSTDGGATWSTATAAGAANVAPQRRLGGATNTAGTDGTLYTEFDWCVYLGGQGYLLAETHSALRDLLRAYARSRARIGLG